MKKKPILLLSALLLLLLFFWAAEYRNATVMDVPLAGKETYEALQEKRTKITDSTCVKLYVNGTEAAFEKTEACYYIPEHLEEGYWKGTLTAALQGEEASVVWKETEAFSDMNAAIQEQTRFTCLVYNDSAYMEQQVLFTGMPVLCIEGEMGAEDSVIRLLDPVFSSNGAYEVLESNVYFNIRGNASKRFEKLGYKLEFLNEDRSEGQKVSLLGMRSDDDWQLKAMYSDRSKLRDRLSIELWNTIAQKTESKADDGCRMEYVELFLNGEYRGLYGLVEPTDYKSLGLNKNRDILYKVGNDVWPDDAQFDESVSTQSFSCGGVTIKQGGKEWNDRLWEPFRAFWNSGYEMESEEDLERLYACIDRQNFIDYDLYYNMIAGMDNRFKNIFYSAVLESDGTYTIRRIPWDQNYSWGDDFEQGEEKDIKNIRFNLELASRWLNEEVFRNMQAYDPELAADMKATWDSWRSDFLTADRWKQYAAEQMEYLTVSGAFQRDSLRWPDSENMDDTEAIGAYIDARLAWLDNYLEDLAEQ